MTTPIFPPVCPGCDLLTAARRIGGAMRWACLTADCPVVFLEDSCAPPPPDPAVTSHRTRHHRSRERPSLPFFEALLVLTATQLTDTIQS
jgi:hypothetical protein